MFISIKLLIEMAPFEFKAMLGLLLTKCLFAGLAESYLKDFYKTSFLYSFEAWVPNLGYVTLHT